MSRPRQALLSTGHKPKQIFFTPVERVMAILLSEGDPAGRQRFA